MKKTEEELLKNHICMQPFRHIELFKDNAALCCPTWLKKPILLDKKEDGSFDYDVWNSEGAQEIRQSILDGNYKFCDKKICPHLNTLITTGVTDRGIFIKKDDTDFPFFDYDGIKIDNHSKVTSTPGSINFTFDDSCNFKCPSCRLDTIMAKPDEVNEINKILDFINNNYAKDCRKIVITGSGDPFASKSFRKFLFEFDPKKWPNLKTVYLVSNGKLFNKKNWDMMKNIQPYITQVEISIDAGTKETYETKTRIGGHWETLMENLKFISTIKTIELLRISFVVQNDNYKEMSLCAEIMCDIFKDRLKESPASSKKTTIYFGNINKWDHMTDKDMEERDVSNPNHPNHRDFIKYVRDVYKYENKIHIQSNLTYLLNSLI